MANGEGITAGVLVEVNKLLIGVEPVEQALLEFVVGAVALPPLCEVLKELHVVGGSRRVDCVAAVYGG